MSQRLGPVCQTKLGHSMSQQKYSPCQRLPHLPASEGMQAELIVWGRRELLCRAGIRARLQWRGWDVWGQQAWNDRCTCAALLPAAGLLLLPREHEELSGQRRGSAVPSLSCLLQDAPGGEQRQCLHF